MKHTLTRLALLFTPFVASHAADALKPESSSVGAVANAPYPHFRWQREVDVKIEEVHRIQISRDETFAVAFSLSLAAARGEQCKLMKNI